MGRGDRGKLDTLGNPDILGSDHMERSKRRWLVLAPSTEVDNQCLIEIVSFAALYFLSDKMRILM